MGKSQLLSHGMFGFGFKHTKLGISSFQKCVSFIVLVSLILGLSVIFTEWNTFIIWSEKSEMSGQQKPPSLSFIEVSGEKTEMVNLFQPRNNCTVTFTLLPHDEVLNEILYFPV